ncbi:MAG: hypothetical protein ACYDEH_07120 [Acidimicrobiales bacterium]
MSEPFNLPAIGSPVDELWETLLELAGRLRVDWTIIGGIMVFLHAIEHQTLPPAVTQDADVVANIRAAPSALRQVVDVLSTMSFGLEGISAHGIAHRYTKDGRSSGTRVVIDVLAPEGVGGRANLTTTKPGRTIMVRGGTQALERTERVGVRFGDLVGALPRPNLLGAIVSKAVACGLPEDVTRHLRDLAFLRSLVDDPFALRDQINRKDRRRLQQGSALDDYDHASWRYVSEARRGDGFATWEILRSTAR